MKIFHIVIGFAVCISAFAGFRAPNQAPALAFGNSEFELVYEDLEWFIGDSDVP